VKREAGDVDSSNRLLVIVVVVLAASVLVTGGLAVYLTLVRAGGEAVSGVSEPEGTAGVRGEPRIAFVSDEEGGLAVYVTDADGSNAQRVSEPNLNFCPYLSWSPDGQRVAYVGMVGESFRQRVTDAGVWVSQAGGTEHVRVSGAITSVLGVPPAWSSDGALLAFAARREPAGQDEPGSTLYVVQAEDGKVEQSIPLPWIIYDLAWSPAASTWLFVDGSPDTEMSVHVLSRQEDGSVEFAEVFRGASAAAWSPDGEEIAVGDYQARTLLVVGTDREPRQVAQLAMQPVAVAWSPDGARSAVAVAGSIRQGYATSLYVVTLKTGELTTVVKEEGWLGWPTWSPDGQRLLFTLGPLRQRTGTELPYANLWTYELASGTLEQLTVREGFAGLGTWSP
jgi:hypothetical protein